VIPLVLASRTVLVSVIPLMLASVMVLA